MLTRDFDLEGSLGDEECRNDVVEVHNGPASWSPTMGKFCGKSLPRWLHSDSNQMRIFFKSNKQYAGRGFKATYEVYKETDGEQQYPAIQMYSFHFCAASEATVHISYAGVLYAKSHQKLHRKSRVNGAGAPFLSLS